VHAGTLSTADRELIQRCGVGDLVEHVGLLDRTDVTALQRSADALVLITSRNSSEATAKVFEYLAAGRPILALAEGNEAARIVDETRTGLTVPPDDVDAIAKALGRIRRGELGRDFSPTGIERYKYPGIAKEMAEALEQAIALRRTP
jgi:glycosyltransferase involved in cell wall biosynthesis